MAKNFNTLRKEMSPESQERAAEKTARLIAAMDMDDLRQHRHISQEDLAKRLDIVQSSVSRRLHGKDAKLSKVREVVEAMGGHLEVVAAFPEGERVRLKQFE